VRRILRRALRIILDLAVIGVCIACIVRFARRREVDCTWTHMRAACMVEVEDSLGRVEHDAIDGVRGAAYRNGKAVGLVTDAEHKGEHALFGTHEVELEDEAAAVRLLAFATDREPEQLSIHSGLAHPRMVTAAMLMGLLAYSVISRRRKQH
jgi:hypothetical protein